MIELVPYVIIIFLIIVIYCLGEARGKDKAEKEQAEKTLGAKIKHEQFQETRLDRLEADNQAWKDYVGTLDYSTISDTGLIKLHQGKRLDDPSDYIEGLEETDPGRTTG